MNELLVTVEEAARRLSIGRSHVYDVATSQQDASVAYDSDTGNDYVDHASNASKVSEVSDQPDAASEIKAWEETIA